MRRILHGDVTSAARALLAVPQDDRGALMSQIMTSARYADCYVKRFGRVHSEWGNGSLMAAARQHPLAGEPSLSDKAYCTCLVMVLSQIIAEKAFIDGC